MSMIKAIIMDMDGTLLNKDNKITPKTKQKLLDLQKQGTRLILASGRSYTRLLPYAKELEMEKYGGMLIEVDGIAYYDLATNTRHVLKRMEPEEIKPVFTHLMDMDCESMACFDNGLFDYIPDSIMELKKDLRAQEGLDANFPWTAGPWSWFADLRDGYPKLTYIDDFEAIDRPINKLQIMQDEQKIIPIYEELKEKFGQDFEVFRTTPRQLEVLPFGYSKGKTLRTLMKQNGWNEEEVVAFGDGENDVSMFEVVNQAYAMKNAQPFVQEQAAYITPASNNEDGIALALEEIERKEKQQ